MGIVPHPRPARDDGEPDAIGVALAVEKYLNARSGPHRALITEANAGAVIAAATWLLNALTSTTGQLSGSVGGAK